MLLSNHIIGSAKTYALRGTRGPMQLKPGDCGRQLDTEKAPPARGTGGPVPLAQEGPDLPFLAFFGKARKTTQKSKAFFSMLNP